MRIKWNDMFRKVRTVLGTFLWKDFMIFMEWNFEMYSLKSVLITYKYRNIYEQYIKVGF